ncbi:MAG: hypothetical protein JSU69_00570 [Candidatus Zixiibacteriota bacterium]|nr:MAG: hypothetical protein JSU69_00570 [candidate division Zixibacteria bacterium]
MIGGQTATIYSLPLLIFLLGASAASETFVRDSAVVEIADRIWRNEFRDALSAAEQIIRNEPSNPVGYFLAGVVYQTISEEYRNDSFIDSTDDNLSHAIELTDHRKDSDRDNPDWYFIAGAAYGYRGLHRAFHGQWWGAFKDGFHCSSNLRKALGIDSTYYDANWGLGSYYYYRTVKSRDFLWLPFISDEREEGMRLIRRAIAGGFLCPKIARQSFLRIYLTEERYADVVMLADSLCRLLPDDPYYLLFYTEGLLAMDSLDRAEEKLEKLKSAWKNSSFYDASGVFEAELLYAKIAYKRGDREMSKRIVDQIISNKRLCRNNAYFEETYDKAKKFRKSNL